jgi:hypothetical protein
MNICGLTNIRGFTIVRKLMNRMRLTSIKGLTEATKIKEHPKFNDIAITTTVVNAKAPLRTVGYGRSTRLLLPERWPRLLLASILHGSPRGSKARRFPSSQLSE